MMKTRIFSLTLITTVLISVIYLSNSWAPARVNAAPLSSHSGWKDDFDAGTPHSRWTWVNENPAYWSLAANPGYLRLVTRGDLYLAANNAENILLTPVSNIDYRIITKLNFSPTEDYQKAGLLVYQDDDNYLQVARVYSLGNKVRIRTEIGGAVTSTSNVDETAISLYLRIDKFGDDYYGYYSLDGDTWEFIGQNNLSLTNPKIGLFAGKGVTTLEINADFDFFEYMPLSLDQSWKDDFNGPALESAWWWKNEAPSHWSLSTNPGFLRIITQPGSTHTQSYHNFLVTEAPSDGDYRITTRAIFNPTENFQGATIVVYGDDFNFVRVARRYGDGNQVNFRYKENDIIDVNYTIDETATSLYLRITKVEDVYTGYYSLDGNSYNYIGHTKVDFKDNLIGIVSENGQSTTEIPSDYDFFLLEYNVHNIYLPLVEK